MREGTEGKCTLDFAHVVIKNGLGAVGLGKVEAVVDLQALTHGLQGEKHCVGAETESTGRERKCVRTYINTIMVIQQFFL